MNLKIGDKVIYWMPATFVRGKDESAFANAIMDQDAIPEVKITCLTVDIIVDNQSFFCKNENKILAGYRVKSIIRDGESFENPLFDRYQMSEEDNMRQKIHKLKLEISRLKEELGV